MPKQYDQSYFDHWYRDPKNRVFAPGALLRKVRMTLSVAEYYLGHPVRSVLDVGCGEAPWRSVLLSLRPTLRYTGLDASEYVVQRYGTSRNLRLLRFGQLAEQRFGAPVDLLVCSDVMHYLTTAEVVKGLSGFRHLCNGVAFLEVFAKGDEFIGDTVNFVPRTRAWYLKAFAQAGFASCGSHCYLGAGLRERASALELGA